MHNEDQPTDLWVFAYGSLIWNPGFQVAERIRARLTGFKRAFCMASVEYRGTEDRPGLVLALDPSVDTECAGLALRVAAENAEGALAYLRERELITDAYHEEWHHLLLEDGRTPRAVCYVMNTDHHQYWGSLSEESQARIIHEAEGRAGRNCAYLHNTVAALQQNGIPDPSLEALDRRVWALKSADKARAKH